MRINKNCLLRILSVGIAFLIQLPVMAEDADDEPVAPPVTREADYEEHVMNWGYTPPLMNVVLSEVCYWPKPGESEWLELTNISKESIDIKGWQIMDGQNIEFVISADSLVIPSGGCLVLYFDGSGHPATSKDKQNFEAHSPTGVNNNVLGNIGGHIALYSPFLHTNIPPTLRS